MTVINIKDKVKNNKLNLSGLGLTEIPAKEIVSIVLKLFTFRVFFSGIVVDHR